MSKNDIERRERGAEEAERQIERNLREVTGNGDNPQSLLTIVLVALLLGASMCLLIYLGLLR